MTLTRPLRLVPGVVLAIVLVLARFVPGIVAPDAAIFELPLSVIAMLSAVLWGLAIVLWWLFFSRAPWVERVGAVALMVAAVFAARLFVDESIRGAGQGMMLFIYAIPVLPVALVVWAVVTRNLSNAVRRAWMLVAIALACVPFTLIRTAGVIGVGSELHWRWTPTPEERLLAEADPVAVVPTSTPAPVETTKAPVITNDEEPRNATPVAPAKTDTVTHATPDTPADWPGFRGPHRNGVVRGVRINTDWSQSPPVEMWRRAIGPGWSSFAVQGDVLYTQEQRGDDEVVAAYKVSSGEPIWRHRDPIRFYESNGGAGPRATPFVSGGRVFATGATGLMNALDARTGAVLWSRNAAKDTGKTIPDWGIASSPLVVSDVVVAAIAGQLIGYDAATGNQRWIGQTGGGGYSSPHLATIGGLQQVLLARGARTISVDPKNGTLLWDHVAGPPSTSIVQPALTPDGDVLIASTDVMNGNGVVRLAVAHADGGWKREERWTSRGLKPYFSDFVVHNGHAYGFDGSILSCISLEDGERKWKGGRYGNGQMVLLAEQDLLLVTSEEGELALVSATPDKFTEVARFKALDAKTWNHPVVIRDILLVRNGEEMAAFRLPRQSAPTESR